MSHGAAGRAQAVQLHADAVTRAMMEGSLFITKRGRMGLAPADVQGGDRVMMLEGCSIPLVVRAAGDGAETYTLGIMDGEAMEGPARGVYKWTAVLLK